MRKSRFTDEQIIAMIRDRLGGDPSLMNLFPRKPKGMHWRAYRQL